MGLFKKRLQTSGLCRLDNCNNSERSSRRFIKTSEAPYQMLGKRTLATTLGYKELSCGHFWLSLLSECLSCYLYVFIVCSTRISWTGAIIGHEPNLLAMSLSSGIAMMLLIFTFRTVHVNPALTISFLLTGRIPLFRGLLYILVHCLGAVAAIAFLYSISIKGHAGSLGLDNPHDSLSSWQILIVEIVISFVVTLATYATCNYSSYTSARRFTLEQMGQTSGLFLPASTSCDNANGTVGHHSRNTVAPIVPYLPSTSVALDEPNRGDLISVGNNHNDLVLAISNNTNKNSYDKPYLISNHYNQVYDQYNNVMMKPNNAMENHNDDPNSIVQLGEQRPQQHQYSNDDFVHRPTAFSNNQTMKNSAHLPNFTTIQNEGPFLLNSYNEDSSNYDYEYDNHRIYATQQLKSDNSSQVPIEEVMQDECQLLAPNGFSLHLTSSQAIVIGLAYTLTSLSGIPASGASLNPARSFGPAFIMNRWDHHWIYWLGPILGAVIAGFFYEFVFNPTRRSSLCYRPKLFRFSAQDMAKFGLKSRLYQQQKQPSAPPPPLASATIYRPQIHHHHRSIHHSPTTRASASSNPMTNQTLLKSTRGPQLITTSTSVAQLQPIPTIKNFDQINYLHEHQKQQQQQPNHDQQHHKTANFDRSKSSAIINSMTAKQQQRRQQQSTTMNLSNRNNVDDLVLNIDHSTARPLIDNKHADQTDQVVYDDPNVDSAIQSKLNRAHHSQMNFGQHTNSAANRRSLIGPNIQQRFELGLPSPVSINNCQGSQQQQQMGTRNNSRLQDHLKYQQHAGSSFHTVHSINLRPQSMGSIGQGSQQLRGQFPLPVGAVNNRRTPTNTNERASNEGLVDENHAEELDEELYNVLSESCDDQLVCASNGQRTLSNEPDYSNQLNTGETSDSSSQRTNEMGPPVENRHLFQHQQTGCGFGNSLDEPANRDAGQSVNNHSGISQISQRDYVDVYYN